MSENSCVVSVIVCCYNSVPRLPETLKHLSLQEVSEELKWEVVLVDNNSTDGTGEKAQKLWQENGAPIKLKVVKEPKPGLTHARERGVVESQGMFLIFCDDDNWLFPDYLSVCVELFKKKPEVGIIGGEGIPIYEKEPDEWFLQKNLALRMATGKQASQTGYVSEPRRWVYGAGMAIRKRLFLDIQQYPFLLEDRKGKLLTGGGDVEICYLSILEGSQIWFEERLKFYHYMPAGRCDLSYLKKLFFGQAYSGAYTTIYELCLNENSYQNKNWIWMRLLYHRMISYAKLLFDYDRKKREPIDFQLRLAARKGYLIGHLSLASSFDKELKRLKNNFV